MMSRLSFAVLATAALPLLAGCAMNSTATSASLTDSGSLHVQGTIHGGQQALYHARIQLYQVGQGTVAGAPGYVANAVPLITASVYSAANGSFSITGDYSCATGSQVYLTASGGSVDGNIADSNPNIAMMAALGSCSSLLANAATAFVSVNEISTVASAYALAQFSGNSAFGTALSTQPGTASVKPADNFATSSSNSTGLSNAMATAQVIADYYSPTGAPTGFAPGKNTNGSAVSEYWTVNTIANILAACINSGVTTLSTAGDGTICGTLYTYTTPSGKTAPADTLQSALYMALYPGDSNLLSGTNPGQNLANLISATPPFQPYVFPDGTSNFINDWTIAINYQPVATGTTTKLVSVPYDLAIDSVGNVWVNNVNTPQANGANSYLLELDPTGNPVFSGITACRATPCVAADFLINGYHKSGGSGHAAFGLAPGAGNPYNVAIDPSNNVWYADRKDAGAVFIKGSGSGSVSNGGSFNQSTSTAYGTLYSTGTDVILRVDGNGQPWFSINVATSANAACTNSATTGYSTVGTVTGATGTTGTGSTSSPYFYGANGTVAFGGTGGSGANTGFIDAGNPSCSSGSTTSLCNLDFYDRIATANTAANALPGSPFFWTVANSGLQGTDPNNATANYNVPGTLGMYNTTLGVKADGTTANTVVGCEAPLGQIGTANSTVSPATTVNSLNAGTSNQLDFAIKARNLTFGPGGQAWLISNGYADSASAVTNDIQTIKLGYPYYGTTTFTSAGFESAEPNPSFAIYNNIGGLGTAFVPQGLMLDGNGSPWVVGYSSPLTIPNPVVHLSATGFALSPSTGFLGATFNNGTTTLARSTGNQLYGNGAIDGSGNVWVPNGSGTSTSIYEIVGSAAPVVTPIALGVKNGTLGMMP